MSAPFMQLYVADYLGDTRHLTTEQHGAYLLLLMTMWRSDGRLQNDDKKLARIAGCTPSRWSKISCEVLEFFEVNGEDLTNKRLTSELKKASEKSIKRAVSGTQGGKAKSLKTKDANVANASGLLEHSSEPEPDKSSVTDVTGKMPSPIDPPDDLAELRSLEPKAAAWALSRRVLCERGGLPRTKAGEIVGKLFRDHSLSPGELWEAAEATWRAGTEAPVPYLTKLCATAASKRGGADLLEPSERQQIAWMEDWVESPSNWRGTRGPRPGEPMCRVRPDIQYRFGVTPDAANDLETSKSGEAA